QDQATLACHEPRGFRHKGPHRAGKPAGRLLWHSVSGATRRRGRERGVGRGAFCNLPESTLEAATQSAQVVRNFSGPAQPCAISTAGSFLVSWLLKINLGGEHGSQIDFPRGLCCIGGRSAVWPQSWRGDREETAQARHPCRPERSCRDAAR